MSTKIYNGYIIREKMTLMDLNKRMIGLRVSYRKGALDYYKVLYMNLVYLYEDLYVIDSVFCKEKMKKFGLMHEVHNKENALTTIAFNVHSNLRDKIVDAMDNTNRKNPVYDISASLQVFPFEDKILLLFYGNSVLEELLLYEADIEEYHYQNQSDIPEDMTEEEWNERYLDWKSAMPTFVPPRTGFGVQLVCEYDLPFTVEDFFLDDEFEEYKKPLEYRLKQVVENYFVYPGFTGNNYNVFLEQPYKDFLNEKKDMIRQTIEKAGDPLEKLYKYYKGNR